MSPREVCAAIQLAQREAAEIMLGVSKEIAARDKTDRRDLVTVYDGQVQELLIRRLSEALPEAKFFCEENDRQDDLMAEELFIIDPIDGTMNFVHHLNHSAISVAYTCRGVLEAAAVYNPYVDEMFTAVRGEGAYLNGRRLQVETLPLEDTLICFGSAPYNTALTKPSFALAELAYRTGLDIRRQGTASLDLCTVAAGRAGAYFELSLSLWDYAAGALIVSEAGGMVTKIDGSPVAWDGGKSSVLAASPENSLALQKLAETVIR